jgi:mRNA-degrading endonuclease RelE of RelBE toxin-antitoxin system
MDKILELDLNTLDIKKMKGFTNKYRARVGDHRIIFTIINKKPNLESIKNRDENTY